MQGEVLCALDDVVVEHLYDGDTTPLGTGQLQLIKVQVPLQSTPGSSRPGTSAGPSQGNDKTGQSATATTSTLGADKPPVPPRPHTSKTDEWLLLTCTATGDAEPFYELPVPSSSRIITTPPSSYIIPNAIASTEDAGFIKLTLPTGIDTERRETFEAILWGLTSFSTTSSRAEPGEAPPSYADPAMRSKLVIVNEKGAVVGTLANNMTVSEDPLLSKEGQGPSHEKEPVVIEPSASASSPFDFSARPVSAWQGTPNPTGSSIITAADWVSNGIIVGADMISRSVEWGAGKYITSRKATDKPMEFSPAAKTRADKANLYTGKVVVVSSKAARAVGDAAAAVGGRLGKGLGIQSKEGEEPKGLKGLVNKSLVAFNTVLDAAEQGGKSLLASGSQSTTQVVNHAYGGEAADISRKIGGSVQHCALVYIDARGVSRRAILKGVGKGALRAKISDGREVILSSENQQSSAQSEGTIASGLGTGSTGGTEKTLAGKR